MTDYRTTKFIFARDFLDPMAEMWSNFVDFISENISCVIEIILVLLVLVGSFIVAIPVTFKGTVTDYRWENTINVDRYTLCSESDWNLPEGATLVRTQEEIHHYQYQTIHVGKTTTTISHPVYKTKYYYTIYRWVTVDHLVTGAHDRNLYWAETELPTTVTDPVEGALMQGKRCSACYVTVLDKNGNKYEEAIPYEDWIEYDVNSSIAYKTTLANHWSHKV